MFTIGVLVANLFFVVFAHMLLSYPDGRLQEPLARLAAGRRLRAVRPRAAPAAAVGLHRADGGQLPRLPGVRAADRAQRHAARRLQRPDVGDRRVIVAIVLVVLIRQWRAATAPQRRGMAPILWSGVALLVLLAGALGTDAAGISRLTDVLGWLGLIVFASVPWVS